MTDSSSTFNFVHRRMLPSFATSHVIRFRAVDAVLDYLKGKFPEMKVLSLSGNYCVDKKASAINW